MIDSVQRITDDVRVTLSTGVIETGRHRTHMEISQKGREHHYDRNFHRSH